MDAFERIAGMLDYPMFVVTTRAGDQVAGCLVGFTSQVSINPARFLVGLSKRNHTYRVANRGATHLAVHLLDRRHRDLARLFGSETGDRIDKFSRCDWREGPEGVPVLTDAAAWFTGRILGRFDLGDHVGHLIKPHSGELRAGQACTGIRDWVSFSDVRDLEPGHNA